MPCNRAHSGQVHATHHRRSIVKRSFRWWVRDTAGVDSWQTVAARNNAEWCDVVVRSHASPTRFDDDAWTSGTRTPPYYPDAVTLVPSPDVPDLLSRIEASAGCSIKDSFASLDLAPAGFRVLFDAEWIVRTSPSTTAADPPLGWTRVRDREELSAWENAWRSEDGPTDLFRPELLHDESVAILARHTHNQVVAGGVLNRSSTVWLRCVCRVDLPDDAARRLPVG